MHLVVVNPHIRRDRCVVAEAKSILQIKICSNLLYRSLDIHTLNIRVDV